MKYCLEGNKYKHRDGNELWVKHNEFKVGRATTRILGCQKQNTTMSTTTNT